MRTITIGATALTLTDAGQTITLDLTNSNITRSKAGRPRKNAVERIKRSKLKATGKRRGRPPGSKNKVKGDGAQVIDIVHNAQPKRNKQVTAETADA